MNIHKQVATTALLLMLFATVGAGVVGLTFDSTIDDIEHNRKLALLRKLNTILPANEYDNSLLEDTFTVPAGSALGNEDAAIAYRARLGESPVAVVLPVIAPNGYNGPIHILVGIYADGRLAGVRIVRHRETPGLGDAIEAQRSDWVLGFRNKSLLNPPTGRWKVKRDGGDFDQFTGATITPRAVVGAIHASLIYFAENREQLLGIEPETHYAKTQEH